MGGENYQSDISGQTVTHAQLVASAQGSGGPLSWTLVQPTTRIRMGVDADADGILDQDDTHARVNLRMFLDGPYQTGGMKADLGPAGLLPGTDPYGLNTQAAPNVLARQGMTAPVDWALVELRNNANPTQVVATRAVLVQRSGDVMMPGGEQTVTFPGVPAGNYHVVVRHRNHLGAMTFQPVLLREWNTMIDLTDPSTPTYGTDARRNRSGVMVLWAGDVTGEGTIKYAGSNNDRDPILVGVGGTVPTATAPGYLDEDVNLDGVVKYTGSNNDRDPILQSVGGTLPTAVKVQQLP